MLLSGIVETPVNVLPFHVPIETDAFELLVLLLKYILNLAVPL